MTTILTSEQINWLFYTIIVLSSSSETNEHRNEHNERYTFFVSTVTEATFFSFIAPLINAYLINTY